MPEHARQVRHPRYSPTGSGVRTGARRAALIITFIHGFWFPSSPAAKPAFEPPPGPEIHRVGAERALKTPSAAAALAKDGDIIEIDAGSYVNDYADWRQDDLEIRGMGGMAHLQSSGLIPNGKAIWIVSGNNILMENLEFSGARVKDTNGAGIRHEGGDLILRNTFFHHNEFSVLTGNQAHTSLDVANSRFWYQKREGTFSHGIYVGAIKHFQMVGSHIRGTDRGHQLKSRARKNFIAYNRIEDVPNGNSSRLLDLPNCGLTFVIGNDLHQAESTHNVHAIGYGGEGCDGRNREQMQLYVVNNTFVNEAWGGTLVRNHVGGDVFMANNLLMGRGFLLLGKGEKKNNLELGLSHRLEGSWAPPPGSAAIDGAAELAGRGGVSLLPRYVFTPPAGISVRSRNGPLDIGSREARELGTSTAKE